MVDKFLVDFFEIFFFFKLLVVCYIFCFGGEICYGGDVVIIGDVNLGSSIVVDGDIFIWGCLWGMVYVGVKGND